MSELSRLMREILLGDEPFDTERARRTAEDALALFDRRLKAARWLFATSTVVLFAATVWLVVLLVGAEEGTPMKHLLIYAAGAVIASNAVGLMKSWYFNMHNHTLMLKELRRLEARLLDRGRG